MIMKDKYELVIGLEVHAQLQTVSKAYFSEENTYGSMPNTNISVLTLAHPGTLPKANKTSFDYAIKMGLALGSHITPPRRYRICHCQRKRLWRARISQSLEPIIALKPGFSSLRIYT